MSMDYKNFPSLKERENLEIIRKYIKLNNNEQLAVLGLHDLIKKQYKDEKDIVYLSHPIPERISDFYSDFVAGDTEKMIFVAPDNNDNMQKEIDEIVYENDLPESIGDYAETQSIVGYTVLYAWVDDENVGHIDEISPDQYFPQSDGSVIIATYKIDPTDKLGKKLFLYIQHFMVENDTVKIVRKAFETNERGVATNEVDLSVIGNILGKVLEPETTIDNLNELPFRKVLNNKLGKSDYAKIMPQLAEINERVTQNSTQFLKNIDAKMQIPASMLNEDGKVDAFDYILMDGKDQPNASYITNTNPLMADAREHIMYQVKMIEATTGVPFWALTKGNMPERVEALKISLFQSERRTAKKRAKIKRAIQDLFLILFKLKNIETTKGKDVNIVFSDIIPTDELTQTNVEVAKTQSGLSSRKSSIMRLEGYTEAEADKEIEQIKNEDTSAGLVLNNPTL